MRRLWPMRQWRAWRRDRRLPSTGRGSFRTRYVGVSAVPTAEYPQVTRARGGARHDEDPPLMTMGQRMLYRVPEVTQWPH